MTDRLVWKSCAGVVAVVSLTAALAGCGSPSSSRTNSYMPSRVSFVDVLGQSSSLVRHGTAGTTTTLTAIRDAAQKADARFGEYSSTVPASLDSSASDGPRSPQVRVALAAGDVLGHAIFAARCSELARAVRDQRRIFAGAAAAE